MTRLVIFQTSNYTQKETALLTILETCPDKIITLYYFSLFAGHLGVI